MGATRRDSLTLLKLLLEAVLKHTRSSGRGASKTRIVSATGLNPYSFNNYVSQARKSGCIAAREEAGRVYYEPTYRAALVAWALSLISSLLEPPPEVVKRYERLLEELRVRLEGGPASLRKCLGGSKCSIPSDALVECGDTVQKLYVVTSGDPLNRIRAIAMVESAVRGDQVLVLIESECSDPLLTFIAKSLDIQVFSDAESLADALATLCRS